MKGFYQHCSKKHLHRYLAEFDLRYNARSALGVNDDARAVRALVGAKGKRLTYWATGGPDAQQLCRDPRRAYRAWRRER